MVFGSEGSLFQIGKFISSEDHSVAECCLLDLMIIRLRSDYEVLCRYFESDL